MLAAHVLIVDDDEHARDLLNLLLRGSGYETSYAVGAYEALAEARRRRPDAVLLDYSLPGGDALVVLERFRRVASLATVPVIVITAHDHEPREQLARDAGALAFLQKPLDPHELVTILAQVISWPVQPVARDSAAIFRSSPPA